MPVIHETTLTSLVSRVDYIVAITLKIDNACGIPVARDYQVAVKLAVNAIGTTDWLVVKVDAVIAINQFSEPFFIGLKAYQNGKRIVIDLFSL